MNVVLIRSPRPVSDASFISLQFPLNLGYIASYLRMKGHNIQIWDYEVKRLSEDELGAKIKETNPDLIGITCLTSTIISAHKIAASIKKTNPNLIVVAGGAHPTAIPRETLEEFHNFDMVVIGEGEETLCEILRYLKEKRPLVGIKGTAYRQEQGKIKIEDSRPYFDDLNTLPFPARDMIDQGLYCRNHVSRAFSRQFLNVSEIIATRGCPFNCIFCSCHNRITRFRSIDNVIAEVDECVTRYKTSHFSFLDDTITSNRRYILELCKELKKFKDISWDCFARVDTVTPEVLKGMVDSGCKKISYGVESGSQRILKLINKNITIDKVKSAFEWSREAGVQYIEGSFMIGCHPEENREDINLTKKLLFEIDPDLLMLSILVPYPGTAIYKIMQERGYLNKDATWDDFAFFSYRPVWNTDIFSAPELLKIHRALLRKFYLRPAYIFKILKKIKNFSELSYWIKEGIEFIRKTGRKEE